LVGAQKNIQQPGEVGRKRETQYYTLLCYFLGNRHSDVIDLFNDSELRFVAPTFSTYHDLLVILYESYLKTDEKERALQYYKLLKQHYPETAEKIYISTAMADGKLDLLDAWTQEHKHPVPVEDVVASAENFYARPEPQKSWEEESKDITTMLKRYSLQKKSPAKAQFLNILPGAGYLYVGQKQSALTSLLLNGLFIGATYGFLSNGYYAAGAITASFELGWYLGGIYGAGQAAKLYNERIYEKVAFDTMHRDKLFPLFRLEHAF